MRIMAVWTEDLKLSADLARRSDLVSVTDKGLDERMAMSQTTSNVTVRCSWKGRYSGNTWKAVKH